MWFEEERSSVTYKLIVYAFVLELDGGSAEGVPAVNGTAANGIVEFVVIALEISELVVQSHCHSASLVTEHELKFVAEDLVVVFRGELFNTVQVNGSVHLIHRQLVFLEREVQRRR